MQWCPSTSLLALAVSVLQQLAFSGSGWLFYLGESLAVMVAGGLGPSSALWSGIPFKRGTSAFRLSVFLAPPLPWYFI